MASPAKAPRHRASPCSVLKTSVPAARVDSQTDVAKAFHIEKMCVLPVDASRVHLTATVDSVQHAVVPVGTEIVAGDVPTAHARLAVKVN